MEENLSLEEQIRRDRAAAAATAAIAAAVNPTGQISSPPSFADKVAALESGDAKITPYLTPLTEALAKKPELTEAEAVIEGRKDDKDKIRYDLLPTDVMDEVGRVLTFGANKYGDRNWERGMSWGRVTAAAIRHTFAAMRGEDRDPETGYLHAAHAICCLMFLCGYQLRNHGVDDRKPL